VRDDDHDPTAERPVPRGWPDGFGKASDRAALLRLAGLRGIRPRHLHALAWREGTAAGCVAAIVSGRAGSDGDREHLTGADPEAVARAVAAIGARVVGPGDPEYVERLLDLSDPPAVLFVRGTAVDEQPETIAIVGSRRCTILGREVATDLGRRLAGFGYGVASGAARGVDEAAHEGALAARGRTVAVLGAGIDRTYPRTGRRLLERILASHGTLVSEYPPGVEPQPRHFPARNRLIAALSTAVVVVEGVDRSGSRITADHALDLGRDVFAVPGPVTSPLSATPHELIREGATLIRGADDVLLDLGVAEIRPASRPSSLEGVELSVWDALAVPTLPDAVARRAGVSIPEAFEVLTRLELRGLVRSVGGRYERRFVAPPGEGATPSVAAPAGSGAAAEGVPAG
jgi:DNA processing protein